MSDMNTPHRMGAALTYAHRYGLFTLVGIAGEDDLDAPDLNAGSVGGASVASGPPSNEGTALKSPAGNGRASFAVACRPAPSKEQRPVLAVQDSARLRDAMLADIEALLPTTAISWASQMLASKNTLTTDDARSVEQAFEARFATLHDDLAELTLDSQPIAPASADALAADEPGKQSNNVPEQGAEVGPIVKTVRHRNKEHLRFVQTQPCLVCGRQPSDPHHLRFAQPRALGRKVSDEFAVPLCRSHHREAHRASREIIWWQSHGIAPLAAAEALWSKSQSGLAMSEPEPSSQKPVKGQRRRNATVAPSAQPGV
jgi:hypothetical protein